MYYLHQLYSSTSKLFGRRFSTVHNCVNSPFKHSYHGNIFTGEDRIVKDNKLRKLFTKGPKHYEPRK